MQAFGLNAWAASGWTAVGMIVVAALAPLLEGTVRKLQAIVHSRKGPPIIQPYLDLAKLLIKEDLRVSRSLVLSLGPLVFLGATLLAGALATFALASPRAPSAIYGGDVLVFAYLLALAAAAVVVTGMASRSPYSVVGASRELVFTLGAEPVLVLSLLAVAVNAGSLRFSDLTSFQLRGGPTLSTLIAAVAYILALQAQVTKLPFDIAEAETEIMDGPFTEISGPQLAMCKLAIFCKQFIFGVIFVQIFVPWVYATIPWRCLGALVALVFVFLLNLVLVGVTHVVNPRLRIDQAVRYLAAIAVVAVVAMAYAALGT
jgi:formate hydrogenlyase subunit 4